MNLGKEERGGRQLFFKNTYIYKRRRGFFPVVVSGERRCSLGVAPLLSGETCRARSTVVYFLVLPFGKLKSMPRHHTIHLLLSLLSILPTLPTSPPHIHTYKETHYGFLPGLAGASFGKSSGQQESRWWYRGTQLVQ